MGKQAEKLRRTFEHRLDELSEQFDEALARLRPEGDPLADELAAFEASAQSVRERMVEVQAEIEESRVALGDSRASLHELGCNLETEVRARFAEIDARGSRSVAVFESSLLARYERVVAQTDEEIARWSAEATGRIDDSLQTIEVQIDAVGEQLAHRTAAILAAADQAVADTQERARQRTNDSSALELEVGARIAEIDARSAESLAAFESSLLALYERVVAQTDEEIARWSAKATGRIDDSLQTIEVQIDAVGEQLAHRTAKILAAADQAVADAQERAGQRLEDAPTSVEQLQSLSGDDALPDVAVPAEPLEWRTLEDLAPTDAMWDEPTNGALDDESEPLTDDDFFGRMAAELRDEEIQRAFASQARAETTAAPSTPGPETGAFDQSSPLATATRPDPHRESAVERARRRPVKLRVPLAALTASTEVLSRYAADERIRVEVVHVAAGGQPASFLRLTAYNLAGWWEYHDVPAQTDSKEPQSAVVNLGELAYALHCARDHGDESEVLVEMGGDLTIGNLLLLDQPGTDPVLPYHRERIEHVDLRAADRSGLNVETQIGRVFIPPRMVSFLRTRNYRSSEILMVEGWPCLAAQVASPTAGTAATIITRLGEEGAPLDESAEERRSAAGSEVAQLIQALSADTSAEELEQILQAGVGYARRRAAAHPALPPAIIHDLIAEGTEAIRAAAASNPAADQASWALAAADGSEIVRAAVAGNPAVTTECIVGLAADPVAHVRERAAANVGATRELLARLAEDIDSSVRATAAGHPNIERDSLFALAHDPDPRVCTAVAQNPACPAQLLTELLALVPDAVLANPSAPAAVLAAGSRIDVRTLRSAVAANPATPVKQLQLLARDSDPEVVRAVAKNSATPANVRRRALRRLNSALDDRTEAR